MIVHAVVLAPFVVIHTTFINEFQLMNVKTALSLKSSPQFNIPFTCPFTTNLEPG
jgi:hypothetical protein